MSRRERERAERTQAAGRTILDALAGLDVRKRLPVLLAAALLAGLFRIRLMPGGGYLLTLRPPRRGRR